jgi:hypothetical protein
MKTARTAIPTIFKSLPEADWLLPGEDIEFQVLEPSFVDDNLEIRATLVSQTRWRVAVDRLNGRLIRMFEFTQRKGLLVDAVASLHASLVNQLRLCEGHPLEPLAFRAIESDEDLAVFADALLERGEIRQEDPLYQALGFARSIVARHIFPHWSKERWPVNNDLIDTGVVLYGERGPVKVYTRGPLNGPIVSIRVIGDAMAIGSDT